MRKKTNIEKIPTPKENSSCEERQKKRWDYEKIENTAWILMAIATLLNTIVLIIKIIKIQG